MTSAQDGQKIPEASPTSTSETALPSSSAPPVETGTTSAPPAAQEPPPPAPEASAEPPKQTEQPRDERGRFLPKPPAEPPSDDPVEKALSKLSRPEPPPKPPTEAKPAEAKPQEAAKADGKTDTLTKDPLADLDAPAEEKAQWRQQTRERFDKLLQRTRALHEEYEQAKPYITIGREMSDVLEKFNLHQDVGFVPPDHLAGLIRAQAAVNRSLIAMSQRRQPDPVDLQIVSELGQQVDRIRQQFNLAPSGFATPEAIKPFEGELPEEFQDLIDVYGFDEARVRRWAALEQAAKQQASQAAGKPSAAPAAQPTAAPPSEAVPTGVDMERLYAQRLMRDLSASGVANPSEMVRVLLQHPVTKQEVMRRYPGVTIQDVPRIFDSLEPSTRYEILKAAHRMVANQLTRPPSPSPTPPPPPTNQRGLPANATPARAAGNGQSLDPVQAAIARLARE